MRRGRGAPVTPLEPADAALSAIRLAEAAAAERLAAEAANRTEVQAARREADELLRDAAERAHELAEQRRRVIRAEADDRIAHEQANADAELDRVRATAREHADIAVLHAVTLVLTGEEG